VYGPGRPVTPRKALGRFAEDVIAGEDVVVAEVLGGLHELTDRADVTADAILGEADAYLHLVSLPRLELAHHV
jgi:hypothetical protein